MTEGSSNWALELRNVSKRYEGSSRHAVDDINLSIRHGEFVTFLGPSGCGKTTTLNMIAGFVLPTEGAIVIDGADMERLPPHKRNIGMVFQQYALFPHMSVWDNIAFPLVERKVPKTVVRERVQAALDVVSLEGLENRRPHELSGGQQQRVALSRALVFDPPILLMDEPLAALDKKLRQRLQIELKRVHRESGITFLFVTHDQEEAMALSDTVVVFDEGRVQQIGRPEDLYLRPQSRFVAEFLGESNLISGTVSSHGAYHLLETADGPIEIDSLSDVSVEGSRERCVMFRPEDLAIGDPSNEYEWKATVTEIVYLGSEERVIVTTMSGASLVVRLVGDSLRIRPTVGDSVSVRFKTKTPWVIPTAE